MPIALIYAGPGVSLTPNDTVDCLEQVASVAGFTVRRLLHPAGTAKLVQRIGNIDAELDAPMLAGADLWLAPGSDEGHSTYDHTHNNFATYRLLRDGGYARLLTDALRAGLGYVGVCAGSYLAANMANALDLAEAHRTWANGQGQHEVEIVGTGPDGQVDNYEMPLLDGPVFDPTGLPNVTVVGRFQGPSPAKGLASMVTFDVGRGKIFLSGPHPEAPNDKEWDPKGGGAAWRTPQSIQKNHQFLASWIRSVARS